jgi:hypothetical protein
MRKVRLPRPQTNLTVSRTHLVDYFIAKWGATDSRFLVCVAFSRM